MRLRTSGFVCRRLAAFLMAGCLSCGLAAWTDGAAKAAVGADKADGEDVLAEALRQNSAEYPEPPAPPSQVLPRYPMASSRTPRHFPSARNAEGTEPRIETAYGNLLRVRIAEGQAISSPAMAAGNVFVGGGFNSHAFYCLSAETGATKWSVQLSDNGPSAPSYYQGTVVVTTESCTCYALDSASGKKLWSVWLGDPLVSAPTVARQSVLVAYPASVVPRTADGPHARGLPRSARTPYATATAPRKQPTGYVLAARNLYTGAPQWQKWIDGHVISAPVVRGSAVYLATFGGTFYKLRLEDGEILLARRCQATSAPVVAGSGIYLTRRADLGKGGMPLEGIIRLDGKTGRQLYAAQARPAPYLADPETRRTLTWTSATETTTARREPAPGDPDYVSGGVPAVAATTPSLQLVGRQSSQELQAFCGSRLVAFGKGLFNCMGDGLLAVDPTSGEKRWSLPLLGADGNGGGVADDPLAAPPAVAGGRVFVATRGGQLLCVDPRGGRITGRVALGAAATSQPVIEGGRIFVGTRNGDLVCVRTNDPKLTGWSQWGGNAERTNIDDADTDLKTTPGDDRLRKSSSLRSYSGNKRLRKQGAEPLLSVD
jgi:Ca-activated chloride channel family protein